LPDNQAFTRVRIGIQVINNYYIRQGRLSFSILDGYWSYAGTFESLYRASEKERHALLV
jgi:glucose-1-phosphate thymidylyltransferase